MRRWRGAGDSFGVTRYQWPRSMAAFTDHLALCDIAVSLGDVYTLVYPRPKDGGIVRVSVGCEDLDDLVEDFERGLSFVA